jgi:catalase-peroxidase
VRKAGESLPQLRESASSSDAQGKFVHDFTAASNKVMNLDRFDLA